MALRFGVSIPMAIISGLAAGSSDRLGKWRAGRFASVFPIYRHSRNGQYRSRHYLWTCHGRPVLREQSHDALIFHDLSQTLRHGVEQSLRISRRLRELVGNRRQDTEAIGQELCGLRASGEIVQEPIETDPKSGRRVVDLPFFGDRYPSRGVPGGQSVTDMTSRISSKDGDHRGGLAASRCLDCDSPFRSFCPSPTEMDRIDTSRTAPGKQSRWAPTSAHRPMRITRAPPARPGLLLSSSIPA